MEYALQSVQAAWRRRGWGIQTGREDERLCNLRFADDIMLVATDEKQLAAMIADVMEAAETIGLTLHMGKTKVLNNGIDGTMADKKHIEVRGLKIAVVETTEYLGRKLSLKDTHKTEVEHRIAKAWGKFMSHKAELCSKHYPLKHRLRLFQATVTATLLYGSGAWTLTASLEAKLRTTQRRMLRWMVGIRRRSEVVVCGSDDSSDDRTTEVEESDKEVETEDLFEEGGETWVEWIRRATDIAENKLKETGIDDWVVGQRRRQYKWAGHVTRRTDNRWSRQLLDWTPVGGARSVGRPRRRWTDRLVAFFDFAELGKEAWRWTAENRSEWEKHEDEFCHMGMGSAIFEK